MGIRTRLKSKIKSMFFGSSTTTEAPRSPSNSFVTPSVSTQVQSEKAQQTTAVTPPLQAVELPSSKTAQTVLKKEQSLPVQENVETHVEGNTVTNTVQSLSDATPDESPKPKRAKKSSKSKKKDQPTSEVQTVPTMDTTGAAFVFEVTSIFPSSCPHCNATSFNNWIRIENKFACGSCNTAY